MASTRPADTLPPCVTSRHPAARVERVTDNPAPRTYGFPGSERDLQNSGFLGPFKARVLLHVLIATDTDHHEIVTAFEAASGQVAVPG